ncbi:MAG TPA: thioredoxin family protein [Casimicrobiaceae bacterium]|nr:thioredoxin family protein [Casimicrobiaceae bacterium]
MTFNAQYANDEPLRDDVDRLDGVTLVEFGSPWCGWCSRAQPLIRAAIDEHPSVRHLKIEDGPGRPLGRSFRVKLWPTLVVMHDGKEVARLVRPSETQAIKNALAKAVP